MTRTTRPNWLVSPLAALVAALALACSRAEAQVKPFKVNGGGTASEGVSVLGFDSPHNVAGRGTFLGKYSGNKGLFNTLTFDPLTSPVQCYCPTSSPRRYGLIR